MSREVHVVGAPLQVKTHVRQRCAWCGVTLIDKDLANTVHEEREDGLPGEAFNFLPMGALWASVRDTSWQLPFDPAVDSLPLDCCTALDPAITQ